MKRSCSLTRRRGRPRGRGGHLTAGGSKLRALLAGRAIDRGGELGCLGVALSWVLGGCARHHVIEVLDEIGTREARRGRRVRDVRPQLGHVVVQGNATLPVSIS